MDAKVILCDFAEVSGGKLFITGAGLSLVASGTAEAPYRVNFALAVLGQIAWEDTDLQHRMNIELVYTGDGNESRVMLTDSLPEGTSQSDVGTIVGLFVAPRSPAMIQTDEWAMPMAVPFFGLGLPQLGSYYFSVRIDGREMDRAAFRVLPPQPPVTLPEGFDPAAAGATPLGGASDDNGNVEVTATEGGEPVL
jgi:hypothetical protein